MATYFDFFNSDNKIKSSISPKKDSNDLKSKILKSVKQVIEEDKRRESEKK
jgi:hypothetical protein